MIITSVPDPDASVIGGKAEGLRRLDAGGFRVPRWHCVGADLTDADLRGGSRRAELDAAVATLRGEHFAVRSSAVAEDGTRRSYAGQFATHLGVARRDIVDRVFAVRASARAEHVEAYRRGSGGADDARMAVVIQEMVHPDAAGVAFGRDPLDGGDRVVVAAVRGLGDALVAGEADGETFRIERDGTVRAHPCDETAIDDAQARAIAELVRAAEAAFGAPQDIEWALADGTIHLLQARPITTLSAGATIVWDNANIAESYGGIVSPLTFSFARAAYAVAYRRMLTMLQAPQATIDANDDALENMLGLVEGRMYYRLANWYRLLAVLPGFRFNRAFMEQMMGLDEGLPPELQRAIARTSRRDRMRDLASAARMTCALVAANARIRRDVDAFHRWFDGAIADDIDSSATPEELVRAFRTMEKRLAERWDTPLVNDFFTMVAFGVLRTLCARWCGDTTGTLPNALLAESGGMISAEPAHRIRAIAARLVADPTHDIAALFATGERAKIESLLQPDVRTMIAGYLATFGDRCESELKLESIPLDIDPMPLYRAIAAAAAAPPVRSLDARPRTPEVVAAIRNPLARWVFRRVLTAARDRIRDRENMRLARTHAFGRVRRIFLALGGHMAAAGRLEDARDIFFLTMEEALANATADIDATERVRERKSSYERYAKTPTPPARVVTRDGRIVAERRVDDAPTGDERAGLGCNAGIVRGIVRVVRTPGDPFLPGEILVTERTDPSWVMIFPAARGILVERGSLLSHAAIVSREMGIPSIVAIPGLTRWLATGDIVAFDGTSGIVRKVSA